MGSRPDSTTDWDPLAESSGYRIDKLAALSAMTRQQLRRIFLVRFKRNPSAWMDQLKLRRAVRLRADGKSGKETAAALGFKNSSCFCHFLKRMSRIATHRRRRPSIRRLPNVP
jgi:AraC-like DNA-binding protein